VYLAREVAEYLLAGRIGYRYAVVGLSKYSIYSFDEKIN